MENRQKLMFIMITVSCVLFLLVIITVTLILRARTTTPGQSSPGPDVVRPTTFAPPSNPTMLPDMEERYEDLPFILDSATPEELWTQIRNNGGDRQEHSSFDITYTTATDSFRIDITTLETDPDAVQTDRVKFDPPVYKYEPADFVQIATVNGQRLFVSRTGGAELVVDGEAGILRAVDMQPRDSDDLSATNLYTVYQLYQSGLSEYIAAFNETDPGNASYDNHFIIRYSVRNANDTTKWNTYRALIQETILGIQNNRK